MPRGPRQHHHIKPGTFASVIQAFLNSPKYDALSASARWDYRHHLTLAAQPHILGGLAVHVIRPALVQAFLDGLADKPAKQKHAQTALKAVEKWALVRDLLPYPITTGTVAPGGQGGHIPWTEEQVRAAEAGCKPHLSRAITLAANTGQRGSDLVRMRWIDIETYDGRLGINVVQQKTGLRIWVPFTQELESAIATWERRPAPILLKEDGHPFTRPQLTNQWDRAKQWIPECAELVLHGLRGFACVRLLRRGAHTRQIADMIGMSELMVKRYTRFAEQRKNAIAAVVNLDAKRPRKLEDRTG